MKVTFKVVHFSETITHASPARQGKRDTRATSTDPVLERLALLAVTHLKPARKGEVAQY